MPSLGLGWGGAQQPGLVLGDGDAFRVPGIPRKDFLTPSTSCLLEPAAADTDRVLPWVEGGGRGRCVLGCVCASVLLGVWEEAG